MFKVKSYYVINSIHKNKAYYGSDFWTSGYKYTYIPTSYAIKYINETVKAYNAQKTNLRCVNWCVVKSEDEQEMYIKITGHKKTIEEFVTQLFERDPEFSSHFTMKPVPPCYVV